MKVVLHIGMQKAGSSTIQKALNGYSHNGVRYANFGLPNHTVPFYTVFSDSPEKHLFHVRRGRSAAEVADLRKTWNSQFQSEIETECDTLIFSAEGLGKLPRKTVEVIRDRLVKFTDRIEIVAYVREPYGFSYSAFQERVKGGIKNFELPQTKYREQFEKYLDLFDDVNLRDFHAGDVLSDFCNLLNIERPSISKNANTSLPFPAIQFLHLFNREGVKSMGSEALLQRRHRLITRLQKIYSGATPPKGLVALTDLDLDDIAWMSKQGFDFQNVKASGASFSDAIRTIAPVHIERLRNWMGKSGETTGGEPIDLLNRLFQKGR